MSSHAGGVNAGQVIIERIDAMVKIVTVDALFWQPIESSKGEASTVTPSGPRSLLLLV